MGRKQPAALLPHIPDDVWVDVFTHVDFDTATGVVPFVCRQFWRVLAKPSKAWRRIDLPHLPYLEGASAEELTSRATALRDWIAARGAAVEELTLGDLDPSEGRILLPGLLGGALPALTSFSFTACDWYPEDFPASEVSRVCAGLGQCLGLRDLYPTMDLSSCGPDPAVDWGCLHQLTSLELQQMSGVCAAIESSALPACALVLPHLRSLSLYSFTGVCFSAWASAPVLQSLKLESCVPADDGYMLQSLSALSRFALIENQEMSDSDLLEQDVIPAAHAPVLRCPQAPCLQASLQVLELEKVEQFPTCVTVLTNLRSLGVCFAGEHGNGDAPLAAAVPADLHACSGLTALALGGLRIEDFAEEYGYEDDDSLVRMDIRALDPSSFPHLQTLSFRTCRLRCGALLAHAAHLPCITSVGFDLAVPAVGGSLKAVRQLWQELLRLGKHGVPRVEPSGYVEVLNGLRHRGSKQALCKLIVAVLCMDNAVCENHLSDCL